MKPTAILALSLSACVRITQPAAPKEEPGALDRALEVGKGLALGYLCSTPTPPILPDGELARPAAVFVWSGLRAAFCGAPEVEQPGLVTP